MTRIPEIAIVTHDLSRGGGTARLAHFLRRALASSGRYRPRVISLATSRSDASNALITRPGSWLRGPTTTRRRHESVEYDHVGAWFGELEFQRYRSRRLFTDAIAGCDVVQFAVGTSAWAHTAVASRTPFLIWTATTVGNDRESRSKASCPSVERALLRWMTPVVARFERRALAAATHTFALSDYTRREVLELGAEPNRCSVAVCGVDTDYFSPADRPSGEFILSVGRFCDPRKNVRLLLRAYAKLVREALAPAAVPDLWLVGHPPDSDVMSEIVETGLQSRVRVIGLTPDAVLADVYRRAALFVLPSDEEGLGLVVVEAMASGIPVISTRCGGPESAVEHGSTGLLTAVGNVDELADSMRSLLGDPARRARMGMAGRRAAVRRFSLDVTARPFLELYDRLTAMPLRSEESPPRSVPVTSANRWTASTPANVSS